MFNHKIVFKSKRKFLEMVLPNQKNLQNPGSKKITMTFWDQIMLIARCNRIKEAIHYN
jgi:hypothetical protein